MKLPQVNNPVDRFAAVEWLKDPKRLSPYEEQVDVIFEEEITLEDLKELHYNR